jgi:hypothetical protein
MKCARLASLTIAGLALFCALPQARQSVLDFKSRSGNTARTWDALDVNIDGAGTVLTVPSTLYLLGLRLGNWGDRHRVAVPNSNCKD